MTTNVMEAPPQGMFLSDELEHEILRIFKLLSDETRLREMGAHSRRIIEERCNIDTYMENLVAALDYTAGAGEPGGEPGGKAGG